MNKLTKEQRDQLIGIAMGTVMLLGLLWYFGVKSMQHDLAVVRQKFAEKQKQVLVAQKLMGRADEIAEALNARKALLTEHELELVPEREPPIWLLKIMNLFLASHNVHIDSYGPPPEITLDGNGGMIPKFPYRWATFHLKGSGYYHDLGKFFADFENKYQYFCIRNVVLSANVGPAMEPEKLNVSFDLLAPVVSSASDTK